MERRRRGNLTNQIENSVKKKTGKEAIDVSTFIPSGSTLLNCACADNPYGAYRLGRIVTLPGGSQTGKTIKMLTVFAECCIDKRFDDYELVMDDSEETASGFDLGYLFGEELQERLIAPATDENGPIHSNTIQDFKANIITRIKSKKKFIYVLDSLDTLTSDEEVEKEYKAALARAKNPDAVKELKGSYKTEKAKIIGEVLRMINSKLKQTDSGLFIVQQERDKIGVVFGKKTTTSGGRAPFFYSSHQVWLHHIKSIPKKIGDTNYPIGAKIQAEVTKNKITGKRRKVNFDIYEDYGIDDISSCVDYLVDTGWWKKRKQTIVAEDIDFEGSRIRLIETIEKEQAMPEIKEIIGKAWNNTEAQLRLSRKRRFE